MLHLLEQQLYLPALAVDSYDFVRVEVHIVGQQRYELALLLITICYYARLVPNGLFTFPLLDELYGLSPHLHKTIRSLIHRVLHDRVFQRFLHLGHIDNSPLGQLLELLIVDIGAIHSYYVPLA